MISPERFLELLEQRELLSPETVAALRAQLAQASKPITAEALAKRLVKHGRLTASQAKRLLSAAEAPAGGAEEAPREEKTLELAPLDDELRPARPTRKPRTAEEQPPVKKAAAKPAKVPPAAPAPSEKPTPPPAKPKAPAPVSPKKESLVEEELSVLQPIAEGGTMLDKIMAAEGAMPGGPLAPVSEKGRGWLRFFRRKPRVKTEEEQWGSALMLIGGGILLSLVILGGVLIWALTRQSGDKMLSLADEDYRGGSYAQAIHKYKAFLEKFPRHAGASVARVRIGTAQLRQATQGGNWSSALQTAEEVLSTIAPERDFKEAHGELAAMLPAIAEGLAADARKKNDPVLLERARKALALANNAGYVPKSLRPVSRLANVEESLAVTERQIARDNELEKTVAAMLAAVKESKTEDAYVACRKLLRQYPDLTNHSKLKQALLSVSAAQQGLVKQVSEAKEPEPLPAEETEVQTTVLAHCETTSKAEDAADYVVPAAVDGAVYGLNAVTGEVLWRRFVGFETNPQSPSFPPTPFGESPTEDALVVDAAGGVLLRMETGRGEIRWRFVLGEPLTTHPVLAGEKILVATAAGKLITIETESGRSPGFVQFPQSLSVAPVVDARRSVIYQIADHANLFVLSLNDGACRQVVFLGHDRGTITTAPLVMEDYLLITVNDGARDAELRIYAIQPPKSDKPEPWLKLVQSIRLGGHVQTPPLADGRRVLITTDAGLVRLFELGAGDAKNPFRELAETAIEGSSHLIRYPLLRGGQFWIADTRLTKYDVQAARGRLMPSWIAEEGGVFIQPPRLVAGMIICVRRKLGMPGAIVSAVAMQEPKQFWQTCLALPPAGEPLVPAEENQAVAVTAGGAIFRFNLHQGAIINKPVAAPDPFRLRKPIGHLLRLPDGLVAISCAAEDEQIGVFDPRQPTPLVYWLKTPAPLSCGPIALGQKLLVCTKAGQILLLDAQSGAPLGEPFQPQIEPNTQIDWLPPIAVNDKEAVVSDGKTKLYRLEFRAEPRPHLAAAAEVTLAAPAVPALAVLGETVYCPNANNQLIGFSLPKLTPGKETALSGRCIWGPYRLNDRLLLATEDGSLFCVDDKAQRLWQASLEHDSPVGAPLQLADHIFLSTRGGTVRRLESGSGKELGRQELKCSLATGPVPIANNKLLVGGHDGTFYELRQP